jgi:7,8-dihydropterin-6-yl-methyl-4-(beta-D-ribofuranosyl)aminobenzene 5'-phosphate synthase
MSETIRLTTLVENTVNRRHLMAEHGVSFHLQTNRHAVLFDTGQSDLLRHNARELDLRLESVDAVALSHGHYDHTGGLPVVRASAPQARFYLHPAAMDPKFARSSETVSHRAGMPPASLEALRQANTVVVKVTRPTEVVKGVFVTGEIQRQTDYEDVGGPFFLDSECGRADPLVDDLALFFDTREGVVVLLGCGHAGVVNTLLHIRRVTNARPIHTVMGGMHLLAANAERITRTVEAFRELGVKQLGPAHCTGAAPTARLWNEYPGRCFACPVGSTLEFER